MKSTIVIALLCGLAKVSLSQDLQELELQQPRLADCYNIDTYKTDFGPGDELVRPERSFFKKWFKKWGKWFRDDCVHCCQNNAGYDGGSAGNGDININSYSNNGQDYQQYDNDPLYRPPDIPIGNHGHIYLPLPHPHRIMSHLHGYFNRPYRRGYGGYGGLNGGASGYIPKEAYAEEKPVVVPESVTNTATYEEPAVSEDDATAYTEKPTYETEENVYKTEEENGDYKKEENNSGYKNEEKNDYKSEEKSDYKKEDKKEVKTYPVPTPVSTQIIQPIVPILAPPVYVYQSQYYPHTQPGAYAQPLVYQAPTMSTSFPSATSYAPPASMYLPPAQSFGSPTYSQPAALYSPPASSYLSQVPSYSPPVPSYSPPATSYSPPASSYSPGAPSYSSPASSYSPTASSYTPPASSYTAPSYTPSAPSHSSTYSQPILEETTPYTAVNIYSLPTHPTSSGPTPNYYKRTYSTSLTYLLPPSPCSNAQRYQYIDHDQPMRSCPELFSSSYALGSSLSASDPY